MTLKITGLTPSKKANHIGEHFHSDLTCRVGVAEMMLSIRENSRGIRFNVYVQPRSSKNMIVGLHGDSLKIKVTAPPVEGAANKACIKFLAKCLSVSASSLEITAGRNSRTKTILFKSTAAPPTAKEIVDLKQQINQLIKGRF